MREDFYKWSLLLVIDEIHGRTTGSRHDGCPPFGEEDLTEEILVEWLQHRLDNWTPSRNDYDIMYDTAIQSLTLIAISDWKSNQ